MELQGKFGMGRISSHENFWLRPTSKPSTWPKTLGILSHCKNKNPITDSISRWGTKLQQGMSRLQIISTPACFYPVRSMGTSSHCKTGNVACAGHHGALRLPGLHMQNHNVAIPLMVNEESMNQLLQAGSEHKDGMPWRRDAKEGFGGEEREKAPCSVLKRRNVPYLHSLSPAKGLFSTSHHWRETAPRGNLLTMMLLGEPSCSEYRFAPQLPADPFCDHGFPCHGFSRYKMGTTVPSFAVNHFSYPGKIMYELDICIIIQTCWQTLRFYHDGCMTGYMVQTFFSKLLAQSADPSAFNLMLTLIQGYLYIMAFLTSVALHLPTSFSHIIEMMKRSLGYLFHDTTIKTARCRYPALVKLWKGSCKHQTTAMLQTKSSFVTRWMTNAQSNELGTQHTVQLTTQRASQ